RAIFLPLAFLQKELGQEGKVNTIIVAERSSLTAAERQRVPPALASLLKQRATLEDLGLTLHVLEQQQAIALESNRNIINDEVARAAQESASATSLKTVPVLSYLANGISAGERTVPYSLVTAVDGETFGEIENQGRHIIDSYTGLPLIIINEWTARELNVKELEDTVSLEYYVWHEGGRLETKKADFTVAAIVPIAGLAADRDLVPAYPGLSESENISDGHPPFPIDLNRVRKQDEDYWHQYRT